MMAQNNAPEFRPDLTSYRVYVEYLREDVNEGDWNRLSLTDIVKACIEDVMSRKVPGMKIKRTRKTVVHVEY